MKLRLIVSAAAAAVACLAPVSVANAGTFPGDFQLPQRWNSDYQPGTHCSTPGQNGVYMNATRRWFKQTDAASVANRNDHDVPVTHTVTEKRVQTTEVSGTIKAKGELAKYLTQQYGFSYVHEQYWKLDQVVGPYTLPANRQGKLVWGFTMLDSDNQDVRCSSDQQWVPVGKAYTSSVPEARYSELRIDDAPVFG
ncbi:hypothetical protein [Corynebacterium tapiri]|uniref:Secreted protein n=1 Tax=Corynebacterium tapiri TaxID=1448266 RepID=A0A5C4U2K2_9CORY|nr:hypothetical protein [Corynebacterium tapiri]TNL96794.1 hypothetical protein FHE74_07170 [Corynebacterium tapiri]